MIRKLVTTVGVGALTFTVYLLTGTTVTQQTNEALDAGVSPPNRDATCPVRLDVDYALDAGVSIYQRLTFPVSQRTLADGGRDVTLPPMPVAQRQAIDVVDWNDCSLAASTGPVAALWGTTKPFTASGVTKPWCRQKADAGLPCVLADGGTFGDRNISLCATRANPATCERVSSGVIFLGDSEDSL